MVSFPVIFLTLIGFSFPANAQSRPSKSLTPTPAADAIWAELLQRSPYPFTLPLPPPNVTPINGTYVKIETKEEPAVHCLRCPDYAPEGGLWKLNLSKGVFRIFHPVTGWKGIGSFYVSGDRLILANDPVCHELWGLYRWTLERGNLVLTVIEDRCAIGLRAMNFTHLPWLSCRPPNFEAAITEHWARPAGCD
jgi:hypothetical protein